MYDYSFEITHVAVVTDVQKLLFYDEHSHSRVGLRSTLVCVNVQAGSEMPSKLANVLYMKYIQRIELLMMAECEGRLVMTQSQQDTVGSVQVQVRLAVCCM